MSSHSELKTSQDVHLRAKQIKSLIRSLKQKIKKIEREGEVAPANCHIIRFRLIEREQSTGIINYRLLNQFFLWPLIMRKKPNINI